MGERVISLKEEHLRATKFGAVIFIVDDGGRIYTQIENENNPTTGKTSGQYSVICETRHLDESWQENIIRGISEETGIGKDCLGDTLLLTEAICWEAGFLPEVWATVAIIKCNNPNLFVELIHKANNTDGVKSVGFLRQEEFGKLDLRLGVRNILNKFSSTIFNDE